MPATNAKSDSMPLNASSRPSPTPADKLAKSQAAILRDHHWTMLQLAVFVIFAALILQVRDSDRVAVPWLGFKLPMMCGSRVLFGVECPGCGLTRSIIALASGNLQQSLHFHRLGWLMALAIVVQIPYRYYALRELPSEARATRVAELGWLLSNCRRSSVIGF